MSNTVMSIMVLIQLLQAVELLSVTVLAKVIVACDKINAINVHYLL